MGRNSNHSQAGEAAWLKKDEQVPLVDSEPNMSEPGSKAGKQHLWPIAQPEDWGERLFTCTWHLLGYVENTVYIFVPLKYEKVIY